MIKKRWLCTVILILFITAMTGTVYSYLSDQAQRNNKMNVGENTIIPEEPFEPTDIVPGSVFVKKPSLKNTGEVNCYVRMMVECSRSDMESLIQMDWNTQDWTEKQADGYYYYKKVLKPEEVSVPIFTKVSVSKDASESSLKDFNIIVYGESIQVGGTNDYKDAWEQMETIEEEDAEKIV